MTRYQLALEHFQSADPILHQVGTQITIPDLATSTDHFKNLCGIIISQQLSTKVADVIEARLFQLFKGGQITAQQLLQFPDEVIRGIGVSTAKVQFLKNIAAAVIEERIQLHLFSELSNEEIAQQLTQLKGVGPWTVEMFLISSLGREDIFSVGDLGLRRAVQKLYGLAQEPTPTELLKLSQKWAPFRTYASRLLWRSLDQGKAAQTQTA
jgi:DNA-3-methyladenine glycosylase II